MNDPFDPGDDWFDGVWPFDRMADPFGDLYPISIPSYFFITEAPPAGVAPTSTLYGPLVGPFGGPI